MFFFMLCNWTFNIDKLCLYSFTCIIIVVDHAVCSIRVYVKLSMIKKLSIYLVLIDNAFLLGIAEII